jgi:hypothetical protein
MSYNIGKGFTVGSAFDNPPPLPPPRPPIRPLHVGVRVLAWV